jgi:hypothetical protein
MGYNESLSISVGYQSPLKSVALTNLEGPIGDNWILVARDDINHRILQSGDDGVNLMALCQSPLRPLFDRLVENMSIALAVGNKLSVFMEDWRVFMNNNISASDIAMDNMHGLTEQFASNISLSEPVREKVDSVSEDYKALKIMYEELMEEQKKLREPWVRGLKEINDAHLEAVWQTYDHTPQLYKTIQKLSNAGVLKEIVIEMQQ